ncbi:hypothetical protein DFP72DRAFT_831614, partial [Ephemerocybe angulata]
HLANDFLHLAMIYLCLTSFTVCNDTVMWARLEANIVPYMAQWSSASFVAKCCIEVNSENPFAFNESLERNYDSGYIAVCMPLKQYNSFFLLRHLDRNHTLGAQPIFSAFT